MAPSSISAGILLSKGWSPKANYSLLSCSNPRRVSSREEHCFEGRKAWLTKQSSEATGVLSSNDACGLSHSQPNSAGREEIHIETTAIRESLFMLASGGGLSYGSPAAASAYVWIKASCFILIWLYLYVASHVSST